MVGRPNSQTDILSPDNSSDAYFINNQMQSFGLADGVGGWKQCGIDPGLFATELMSRCDNLLEVELREMATGSLSAVCRYVMQQAYLATEHYGSSTAIVAAVHRGLLGFASLGDSGILLLRVSDSTTHSFSVAYRTTEQQHSFNSPYQLTNLPPIADIQQHNYYQDSPAQAYSMEVPLQSGDLVIAASDGLFDNLYDQEIAEIAQLTFSETPDLFAATLSRRLTEAAVERGWDRAYESPFARNASKRGKRFSGGKLDDTTVIVGVVV